MSESKYQDWERYSKVDFDKFLKIILEGEAGHDRKNLVTCLQYLESLTYARATRKQTARSIDKEYPEMTRLWL